MVYENLSSTAANKTMPLPPTRIICATPHKFHSLNLYSYMDFNATVCAQQAEGGNPH